MREAIDEIREGNSLDWLRLTRANVLASSKMDRL